MILRTFLSLVFLRGWVGVAGRVGVCLAFVTAGGGGVATLNASKMSLLVKNTR